MYQKLPNHSKQIIEDRGGNQYTVYIPNPPGHKDLIFNHGLKTSDQFWRRPKPPSYYDERRQEELYKQQLELALVEKGDLKRVEYFDPALEKYRRQEWYRRIHGVHVYIKGKIFYLNGPMYWYLTHVKLDHPENDGFPVFYVSQVNRFYFRQLCYEDPWSLGYIQVGPRGYGKTSEEVAMQLENITKPPVKRVAAIQSKSLDDAEEVIFRGKMVPIYKELADFWKPNSRHGTNPSNAFEFLQPSDTKKVGKRYMKFGPDYELGNKVLCYPPQNLALDGQTAADILNDEAGKLKPEKTMDVYTRHAVNKRVVFRNMLKRGIIRMPSTVEDMEQGGDEFELVWDESDPTKRDPNGYTLSGMYRWFVSAIDTQVNLVDIYGYINEGLARTQVLNSREMIKDDPYKLSLEIRKSPLSVSEAFLKNQGQAIFDVMILNERKTAYELLGRNHGIRKGKLEWVNGVVDGEVEFVDDDNGPFWFYYMPDAFMGTKKVLNNIGRYYDDNSGKNLKVPLNFNMFRGSTDPIRFQKTLDPRASKMASHGMMMYIPELDHGKKTEDEWISYNILYDYIDRSTNPEDNYEDIIKAMVFLGMPIMLEANAGDFYKHLVGRGYQLFVILRRNFSKEILNSKSKNKLNNENPVSSTGEVIDTYIRRTATFIKKRGKRLNGPRTINQLLKFDGKNQGSLDLMVSLGYGVLALEANLEDMEDYLSVQNTADFIHTAFQMYNIAGNKNQAINPSNEDDNDFDIFDINDLS
jgi:hypothetical protein